MKMKKLAALLLAGCLVVGNVGIVTAAGEDDNQENQQTTTVTTSEEETDEAGLTVEDGEKTEEITDSKKGEEDSTQEGENPGEETKAPEKDSQPKAAVKAARAAADNSLETVYVSAEGDDENGAGTEESPVASLAKAVEVVKANGTIHLLSNIEAKSLALVNGKSMTIDGGGFTVTRAKEFTEKNDQGRGGYNPAMIEVANKATLTLQNITLDDNFLHEGEKFELAQGQSGNETRVQDGIIASYGDGNATIVLGSGTTLKNFGGLSAVYITGEGGNGAKLIMKSGSKICDDSLSRKGGYAAIFNHGGTVQAENDSSIESIDGRAIYADNAGVTTFAGAIKDITSNEVVKSGAEDAGVAYYGSGNTVFTLASGGVIEDIKSHDGTAADSALHLIDCVFNTEEGSDIRNLSVGVADMNGAKVDIAGSISDCKAKDVFFRMRGTQSTFTLQETGSITKCDADTALIYLNGGKPTVTIAGTIDDINVTALYMSNNGSRKDGVVTLANTGKITNVTGYGMRLQDPSKVTIQGKVSGCSSQAIYYEPKATGSLLKIADTATIENNRNGNAQISVAGSLTSTNVQEHVEIAPGAIVGNTTIDLKAFDVTLDADYSAIQLGNANSAAATAIKEGVAKKYPDWTIAASSFGTPSAVWIQPSTDEVHFTVAHSSYMKKTALYAALIPLNEDGTPAEDAEIILQEVENTDPVDVTLTGLTAGQSYAMMFVNNNEYTLTPDDITIYTGGGQNDETYDNGGLPVLSIAGSLDDIDTLEIDGAEITANDLMSELLSRLEATYTNVETGLEVEDDSEPGEYTVTLSWKDGQKPTSIKINGNEVADEFGTGTLIIRGVDDVTGATEGTTTHELLSEEPTALVQHAEAIAKKGGISGTFKPKFYINDDESREVDASGIQILDDGLLLEDDDNRQELMEQKAADYLGAPAEGQAYRYDFHYLDLVDAFNGNAWVSASYGTTVYLPYPEGVTADNANELGVKVIHYKDLHREYGISGQAEVEEAIAACELETMKVEFDANGIKFDVPREGFSPFAIVWQTEAHTITATAGEGGSIDPAGAVTVAEGADETFTMTPDKGYEIAEVKVDGQAVDLQDILDKDGTASYTFTKVDGDHTIEVTFKAVAKDPGTGKPGSGDEGQQGTTGDGQGSGGQSGQQDQAVKTGDTANILLYALLAGAALLVISTSLVYRRTRR